MQVAWQQQQGWQVGGRERRAGRQEVTGVGTGPVPCHLLLSPLPTPRHRPKSVTSCFFSSLNSFFPRTQANRSHAHAHARRARAHNHHHTGPGTWIYSGPGPDLGAARFLHGHCPPVFPSSSPGGGIVTATSFHHHSAQVFTATLPAHPEACKTGCTRQADRRKQERPGREISRCIVVISIRLSSVIPSISPSASQPARQPGLTDPAASRSHLLGLCHSTPPEE